MTPSIIDHDSAIEIARARHIHLYVQFGLAPDVTAHLRDRLAEQLERHDRELAPPEYGVDGWKRRKHQRIEFYDSIIRRAISQVHRYGNWSPSDTDRDRLITHLATKHEETGFACFEKTYSTRKSEEFWHRDHLVQHFRARENPETGRLYDQASAALQAAKEILKLEKAGDLHYRTGHKTKEKELAGNIETGYSKRNAGRKRLKSAAEEAFAFMEATRAEMEARHEYERSLISSELVERANEVERKISKIRSDCATEWSPKFAAIDARYSETRTCEIEQLQENQKKQLKTVPDEGNFTHRRKRMADRHSKGLLRLRGRLASQYKEELARCRLDLAAVQKQATAEIHVPKDVQEYWDQRNRRNAEIAAQRATESSSHFEAEKRRTDYEYDLFPHNLREWLRYRDHVLDRTPNW